MWKPSLVKVTGDVLQDAWRFSAFCSLMSIIFCMQFMLCNLQTLVCQIIITVFHSTFHSAQFLWFSLFDEYLVKDQAGD